MNKVITKHKVENAVKGAASVIKSLAELGIPTSHMYYMDQSEDVAINLIKKGLCVGAESVIKMIINYRNGKYNDSAIFYLDPTNNYVVEKVMNSEDQVVDFVCNKFDIKLISKEEMVEIISQCGGRIMNIAEEVERLVDDYDLKWHFVQLGELKEQAMAEIEGGDYITAIDIIGCIQTIDEDSIINPLSNNEWVFFDTMSGQCNLLQDNSDIINALEEYYNL